MSKKEQFETNLYGIGRTGELITIDWLRGRGHQVIDITNNRGGHDLIVDKLVKVEVKTSQKCYPFFWVETMQNTIEKSPGWFCYTNADYIAYLELPENKIRLILTSELRDRVKQGEYYEYGPTSNAGGYKIPKDICHFLTYDVDCKKILRDCSVYCQS